MSNLEERYRWALTILFAASLFFLSVHVTDDALTTGEPPARGVSIPEFLLYAAWTYWLIPPLGLILARRNQIAGIILLTLNVLQAIYGAGLNHVTLGLSQVRRKSPGRQEHESV